MDRKVVEKSAKIFWDAYSLTVGGKTFDGKPLPTWDFLTDKVQGEAHRRGVIAVLAYHGFIPGGHEKLNEAIAARLHPDDGKNPHD